MDMVTHPFARHTLGSMTMSLSEHEFLALEKASNEKNKLQFLFNSVGGTVGNNQSISHYEPNSASK